MCKNIDNNEIFIRLIITTNTLDKLEALLDFLKKSNIIPIKIWEKGEYSMPNDKGFRHKNFGFEIAKKYKNQCCVDELMGDFLSLYKIDFKVLNKIKGIKKFLSVVVYSYEGMPDISYNNQLIKFLHDNKIALDHDIYCLGGTSCDEKTEDKK
jgi:hypothetical protein